MKSLREIEQITEQIEELQSIRDLMQEARERIGKAEDDRLEEYLGSVLREVDQRMCSSEWSFEESSPQHPSVRNRTEREGKGASFLSSFVPWEALGTMLAGLAWIVAGIVDVTSVGGRSFEVFGFAPLNEVLYCIALIGMLGGLVGLHTRQVSSYGRLGTVGSLSSFLGVLCLLIGLMLSFLVGSVGREQPAFLDQVLVLGLLGTLVGFVLLGIATLRLGALPRWCAPLLLVSLPLAIILGDYGGAIALGLIWLALAYVLLSHRDLSALYQTFIEPERVSEGIRN